MAMKTRSISILFLTLCCIFGAFNVVAQPRAPKINVNVSIQVPPPPPHVKPVKKVRPPRIFSPVGHIYGFSIPGHQIMFNFSPNGRVYREGDNIGSPFTIRGNEITVYSSIGPQRIIGKGKLSRDGKKIEWMEFSNGARYRLGLIR